MNRAILENDVQAYIHAHLNADPLALILKKSPFPQISQKELVAQIESKKKSRDKLPLWFRTKNIYYPHKLHLSQSSSETTATYKASLVSGDMLADLTGGLGVDAHAFSKRFGTVYHIEKNCALSALADHNFKALGATNIKTVTADGVWWLKSYPEKLDCIFLDPSRRDAQNKRVFFLEDCEPDLTQIMDLLLSKAHTLLLKTGPLLDIASGLNQIQNVAEVHIVAVQNEVKEILWLAKKEGKGGPVIRTVNFEKGSTQTFDFYPEDEHKAVATFSEPLTYLYEPNAAIMKSGAFKLLCTAFNIKKLHPNSHLYTATHKIPFPGRAFTIKKVLPYKKNIGRYLGLKKANMATRNFTLTVAQLRKQTLIQDGGQDYLFFTTGPEGKPMVLQTKKMVPDSL